MSTPGGAAAGPRASRAPARRRLADYVPARARAAAAPGGPRYHRAVMAEFLACAVLISAEPVIGPLAGERPASLARPLVRLTALAVVFFVLALMSSGPKAGRPAAAFGALITAGVAVNNPALFTGLGKVFGVSPTVTAGAYASAEQASAGAAGTVG